MVRRPGSLYVPPDKGGYELIDYFPINYYDDKLDFRIPRPLAFAFDAAIFAISTLLFALPAFTFIVAAEKKSSDYVPLAILATIVILMLLWDMLCLRLPQYDTHVTEEYYETFCARLTYAVVIFVPLLVLMIVGVASPWLVHSTPTLASLGAFVAFTTCFGLRGNTPAKRAKAIHFAATRDMRAEAYKTRWVGKRAFQRRRTYVRLSVAIDFTLSLLFLTAVAVSYVTSNDSKGSERNESTPTTTFEKVYFWGWLALAVVAVLGSINQAVRPAAGAYARHLRERKAEEKESGSHNGESH